MPSTSKSQQRLMGVAYAVKSGDMQLSDVDAAYRDKVKDLVDGMSLKDLKDFASTPHKDLPEVAENITAANIGGMGDISFPTETEVGSGDIPKGRKSEEDEDEKEIKEMKTPFIPTFEAFINETLLMVNEAKFKAGDKWEWKHVDGNKTVEITDIKSNGDVIARVDGDSQEFILREPNKYLKKKVNESIDLNEDWGGSDQYAMNQSIHRQLGNPKKFMSPFDSKLRAAAEDAVDFYWDEWPEYKRDREGLIDNAVRYYMKAFFPKEFNMMARMFENEVNEARSINKIQKDWGKITSDMKVTVDAWKAAEGKDKDKLLAKLKDLTAQKKKLEAELDAAVSIKDADAELVGESFNPIESVKEAKMPEPRKDEYYFLVRHKDAKDVWEMADYEFGNDIDRGRIDVLFQKNKYVIKDFELAKRFYQYLRDRGVKFFDQNFVSESVDEAFIGPFVFNDRMSDEELKAMYNDALNAYANWQKGFEYPKSDYKKAYQEIEKILKKRGVSVDESVDAELAAEAVVNESASQKLADEIAGELYTAKLKGKSATITATTTTQVWDDDVPVLKYLARGKAKPVKFELWQRPFDVVHDPVHGWFYFTDGRKWYGLHMDDGYYGPEDLPFDMTIK